MHHKWRSYDSWFLRYKAWLTTFFVVLSHFLPFDPPIIQPEKWKFWTNEKKAWRYYHFTVVHHKWWSYNVWLLRYGAQHNFLLFLAIFCPFTNNPKIKILKKWKKHLEILSFHMCPINDNNMMYGSWDMEHDRIFCHFGSFFPF